MKKANTNRTIVLVILSLIAGLVYLTPFLRFSFYDQMKEALMLTDNQMGTIGAVYGALNVICYIPSGFLTERFSTKKLLLLSTLGMFICTLWYATFPGFSALIIIHALYGVFSVGTFWCPYLKSVRSLASEKEQGTIFGISEGLRGVGQAVVAFMCLGILQWITVTATGFRAVVLANAVVFALLFLATLLLVPDTSDTKESEKESVSSTLSRMFSCLKNPGIWICIAVIMCGYAMWNTVNGYIGTYTTRVLALPPSLSSALSIIRSYIIVLVAGVSGGFILDRFKTKGMGMMLAYALCGITTLLLLVTESLILLCAVLTIFLGYFVNVIKSTYWSILGDAGIEPEATGRATGIISLIALTPDFFAPPIVSRMITYGEKIGDVSKGFHLMMLWMCCWAILGVAASFILKRKKERNCQI